MDCLSYSGDMKPVALIVGTELATGTAVTPASVLEINIGRLRKPMVYVKINTGTVAATGSMVVYYKCRVADIPAMEELNVTIPVVLDNGYYWGVAAITTDFSTMGISKLESAIDVDTVTYEAGVTGLLI